jgi:hypothetical protein
MSITNARKLTEEVHFVNNFAAKINEKLMGSDSIQAMTLGIRK